MRKAPFQGDLGCGVLVVARFDIGVRNVWPGSWCRVIFQRMSYVEMVVGWSEVEGGELATREGTRSGVPPLKHAAFSSPLYLSASPTTRTTTTAAKSTRSSAPSSTTTTTSASHPSPVVDITDPRFATATICHPQPTPSPPFDLTDRMPPTQGAATTTPTATAP